MQKFLFKTIALAMVSLTLSACDPNSSNAVESKTTQTQGRTMGTFYGVNVVGGYKGGEEALHELAEATFKEIVDEISTFDKNAQLARFNEFKSTEPFEISQSLAKIIQDTVYQGRRIEGATDISVGPLVNLWGFGKDKTGDKIPTKEQIAEAKKLVGFDKFELRTDDKHAYLVKKDPNVRLDLATVGEGLGADALASKLLNQGYQNFLVSVAGASRSFGKNAKGQPWRLGIVDPTKPDGGVVARVCAYDKAVTTAGSYRNNFKDEATGRIYSHAIDPNTGYPVNHDTLSVTVISDSAFESDALDTGLLVLGKDKGFSLG